MRFYPQETAHVAGETRRAPVTNTVKGQVPSLPSLQSVTFYLSRPPCPRVTPRVTAFTDGVETTETQAGPAGARLRSVGSTSQQPRRGRVGTVGGSPREPPAVGVATGPTPSRCGPDPGRKPKAGERLRGPALTIQTPN